ncbi:origin recognition complex subunit 2 isoform X2 [Halyomorpha halys]|uniref:origin recognition complex subunit 2 isoform X2 n=1 Tax=Halyomorpha halys TaxID=286706 RepID=UPI0006D524F7|nr:origin recognition complex subunit 2 isoform X2 [Halyomorpha halys]
MFIVLSVGARGSCDIYPVVWEHPCSFQQRTDVRGRRSKRLNGTLEKEYTRNSPSSVKFTRSGRKITSRFRQLSLNDDNCNNSDCKGDLNESLGEVELSKPDVVPGKLFEPNDIDGKDIFSFRTPKRQNRLTNKTGGDVLPKTNETPKGKISKTIWSPNSSEAMKTDCSKTPYSLRNQLRKRLVDEAAKQELDRLLEDSGSDFVPSSSSDSESEFDSDSSDTFKQQEEDTKYPTPPKKSRQQIKDYVFTSEDYFDRQYSKIMTSSHTLKQLKTPRLAHSQLTALLKTVPTTHEKSLGFLNGGIKNSFRHWLFCFSEGYNVLLYGLGSKRKILNAFLSKYLKNSQVIHINGYFPDTSIKQILDGIASEMLNIQNVPTQLHEIVEVISDKLKSKQTKRIFIVISNLDGKPFQNDKAQGGFAELARLEKIHMIATIDHINSALLWDQNKLSAYNFIWEDCTNYGPYLDETSYEGSLMVNWSGGLALASLKNVFSSLTVNSRKVFKILLNHQLENKCGKYSGMHFSELYRQCREGFIVSSDLALRTLLTEFTDHELVKWKKDTDHLIITVDQNILNQFKHEVI